MPHDHCGAGPAIVFLHGFPFSRLMWREQIEFLNGHGYRVIAPDLRGLGENVAQTSVCDSSSSSDHRLESVPLATMETMARDVAALMDELKIDSAVICGLSMGCYVAFELIHNFPSRVNALILCGPRAQGSDEAEKASREAQAQRVLHEGMGFAVESISKNLLAAATVRDKPDVGARVTEMVLQTDPVGAAAAQRGMAARRDYSNDLPNIKVPTLIVAGGEDGVRTPADAEFIERRIKGSQLLVIDDAGHLMNMEQVEVFNETLLTFLKSVSEARP
ncbi:MAG TPA: alpha/beta hydrolase [Pyrinomonadaceae bacterium]|nr:alpha/beta hydrolase [Pyrinomonadaceae bacterium]